MFQAQRLVFYTCVSPVHMGAGQAVGAIDNPIQREVHTGHPLIAGSGLKGAVRHHFIRTWDDKNLITRLFGPERDASDHAGAIAFTDAVLVAFPVRSLKNTFVYATCPTALGRLLRLVDGKTDWKNIPRPREAKGNEIPEALVVADSPALSGLKLVLEAFEFEAKPSDDLKKVADWLASNALSQAAEHKFFREKIMTDLVVLPDAAFSHFVRHATVVEAHVKIDNDTGTAAKGALFYTENLPPEALLAGLVLATVERQSKKSAEKGDARVFDKAQSALDAVLQGYNGSYGVADRLLQVGGDATTGRGLIVVHPAGEGA